jgi:predicted restriction endonuclease
VNNRILVCQAIDWLFDKQFYSVFDKIIVPSDQMLGLERKYFSTEIAITKNTKT